MPDDWPQNPTGLSAQAQRYLLKAEVQHRLEAGEVPEDEAYELFETLIREANLCPRDVAALAGGGGIDCE